MRTKRTITLGLLGAGLLLAGTTLLDPAEWTLTPQSRIWFTGTSSAYDWICTANDVRGTLSFEIGDAVRTGENVASMKATVPVQVLDCGHPNMDRDLQQALKADAFPEVTYELISAEIIPRSMNDAAFSIRTLGTISAAGAEHNVWADIVGERQDDGTIVFQGEVPLRMSDFGIEPPQPKHLKAGDDIVVQFYLVAGEASPVVTSN